MSNDPDQDAYEGSNAADLYFNNRQTNYIFEEPYKPADLAEQIALTTGLTMEDLQKPEVIAQLQERLASIKGSGAFAEIHELIQMENQRIAWENRPKLNMYPTIPEKEEATGDNNSAGSTTGNNNTGESSLNGESYISGTGGD